tara:strand:+ start:127 stop:462 length:336 start_codon:yes stop_codon:yes gene_type:complete
MANSPSGLNADPKFKMMIDILRDTMQQDFGKNGSVFIDDDTAVLGDFYAIQGINSCKIDLTTGSGTGGQTKVGSGMEGYDADLSIPNGAIIYGHFTKIRLKPGGSCIAYKK